MKKVLAFLGIIPEYENQIELENKINNIVINSGKYCYLLVVAAQLSMLILSLNFTDGISIKPDKLSYFPHYAFLFLLSISMLLFDFIWHKKKNNNTRLYKNVLFIYIILIGLWCCAITLLDLRYSTNITVFTYVLMFISASSFLKPWKSIVLYCLCTALLNLSIQHFYNFDTTTLINMAINTLSVMGFAILISTILYRSKLNSCKNEIIIANQYEQIAQINAQLNKEVMTDGLTGLYNRRYLHEIGQSNLQKNLSKGHKIICLMMDIDFFKKLNDFHGHTAGDICLEQISKVIKDFYSDKSSQIVRYGGEEFLIFRWDADINTVYQEADQVRKLIENHRFTVNDNVNISMTISIGLSKVMDTLCKDAVCTLDTIIKEADTALYAAKASGRNRVEIYSAKE